MNKEKLMKIIQEAADKKAQSFVFKRSAKLDLIHQEEINGVTEAYVLGSDMPNLVYRIFYVQKDGSVKEEEDIRKAVEKTNHYKYEVQPTLEAVPPAVLESQEYEIMLENTIENAGVEVKLKSSVNRDVTMIETYRYFDYVSKVFFVSCLCLSFGGQYLFSVTPDAKHLRLIVGKNEELNSRVNMISELLDARMLPSYRTIEAGHNALTSKDAHAEVQLTNNQTKETHTFVSNFCYDDLESGNMFAFFSDEKDPKSGLMFIQDILDGTLTLGDKWTDQQKAAAEKVQALMKDNPDEFNKHFHSFFADSLDLRYKAFKDGRRPSAEASENKKEEKEA